MNQPLRRRTLCHSSLALAALLLAASFLCLLAINAIPLLFAHERRKGNRHER